MDLDDRPAPATDGRSMLARARARAARGNRAMDICEELEIEEADALAEEMRSRALSKLSSLSAFFHVSSKTSGRTGD
jgi:hypothetical protein